MAMIPLVLTEDKSGKIADGVRQPSYVDYLKLVANAGVIINVPTGANHVLFSCAADYFVHYTPGGITSAVYASSTVDGAGEGIGGSAELNPELRSLVGVDGLSIISVAGGNLTLSWFG